MKKISFILRTYNEEKFIGRLFETLNSQENRNNYEFDIIVVDSSTDETPNIARNYNARIINLPKSNFNWAYALNLGIKKSTGDLIVIMSAHAIPVNRHWLELIVSHFSDANVAGVYCRQIPWQDAPWDESLRLEKTFNDRSARFTKNNSLQDLHFSNAASCIRRDVWEKHNFTIQPASEDIEWAKYVISNGYTIVYEAKAEIYHSHNEPSKQTAMKLIEIEINIDRILGRKRNIFLIIKQTGGLFLRNAKSIFKTTIGRKKIIFNLWECIKISFWFIVDFKSTQKDILRKMNDIELKDI